MKRELDAWEYNWANLSLGNINLENCRSRLGTGRKTDDLALYKSIIIAKSKELKPGSNVAKLSKEDCGSKMAVFA
jgi:hypothetical protein